MPCACILPRACRETGGVEAFILHTCTTHIMTQDFIFVSPSLRLAGLDLHLDGVCSGASCEEPHMHRKIIGDLGLVYLILGA